MSSLSNTFKFTGTPYALYKPDVYVKTRRFNKLLPKNLDINTSFII